MPEFLFVGTTPYKTPHVSPRRLALAVGSRRENLDSMRSLPEGRDPNMRGKTSLADSDSEMEDDWIPPELGSTLELTEDEQHLLNLCLNWEAFRDVPVVDLEATELPPPWNAVDCRTLQAHEEEVCDRDLPILQAYGLLREGTDRNNLLESFAHMDTLMHFPHHTYISTRPGAPIGSLATEQELSAFRKGRSAFLERQAIELQKMSPEQQLQKVKATTAYMCITYR